MITLKNKCNVNITDKPSKKEQCFMGQNQPVSRYSRSFDMTMWYSKPVQDYKATAFIVHDRPNVTIKLQEEITNRHQSVVGRLKCQP